MINNRILLNVSKSNFYRTKIDTDLSECSQIFVAEIIKTRNGWVHIQKQEILITKSNAPYLLFYITHIGFESAYYISHFCWMTL